MSCKEMANTHQKISHLYSENQYYTHPRKKNIKESKLFQYSYHTPKRALKLLYSHTIFKQMSYL